MLCVGIGEKAGRSYCADVDVLVQKPREAFLDGATVDHEKWSIMSGCSYNDPRHILVAPRYRDIRVMMLPWSVLEKGIENWSSLLVHMSLFQLRES
jgi:hypothetical protein